jgi:hypothetical protein
MTTVGGHCGKCGAPYFFPAVWYGIAPPPPTPTCACWNLPGTETTATAAAPVEPEAVIVQASLVACLATDPDTGFVCSREDGHRGAHVTISTRHRVMATWGA